MKKNKALFNRIWLFLFAALILIAIITPLSRYDREEAKEARGKFYSFDDNWQITYEDGTKELISLPYTVPSDKAGDIRLENTLSSEYSGLALSFSVKNAMTSVYINGKQVYDAVMGGNMQPASMNEVQSDGDIMELGENIVDIPESDTDLMIEIRLSHFRDNRTITIGKMTVAKRDIAVTSQMRNAILSLMGCLTITASIILLVLLEIFSRATRKLQRGNLRLAGLGLILLIYSIIRTEILITFFGNAYYFYIVEKICIQLVAVFLIFYFDKSFHEDFPKRMNVLKWLTLLAAITRIMLMGISYIDGLSDIAHNTSLSGISRAAGFADLDSAAFRELFIVVAVLILTLVQMKLKDKRKKPFFEIAGFAFLLIAAFIMSAEGYIKDENFNVSGNFITSGVALFMFISTANHIILMVKDYRADIERSESLLREKIELEESKNSELTEANKKAEDARAEAIAANEAKGRFLANMSHEIRTPINAVLGMDEMILRESGEKEIRAYAMDIYTAGHTLLSLVNDILDFSKIESGKMEIVPAEYDISSLVNDLSNMTLQRARSKDLNFEVQVQSDMPSRYFGDDVRIRQVITNILTNAVKYTHEGNVWLRISGKRDGEDELIHVEVEDTGIGIKDEDIPKLYEAYERIEESRNRNIEGTGLGMNITIQLLSLMGSKLNVESTYGKGSKFYFDLRQRIVDETPVGDFEKRINAMSEDMVFAAGFTAPDARILVVDDNSMNRKVFISLLKATKIKIDEAQGGLEAVEKAKSNRYDIIFMDHMMPEVDGVEAMHRIKNDESAQSRETPVFVLTANAVTGAKESYLKEGFDGFISKPVVYDKLEAAIKNTLPAELLKPAEEDNNALGNAAAGRSFNADDYPQVEGLDFNIAYLHLPSKELIEGAVKDFYELTGLHADKLDKLYESIADDEVLSEYRIQVHGMKSSAATIGITPLAGMAKILEFAARDKDRERIYALHGIFITEWRSYKDKLKGVFGLGEDTPDTDQKADNEMLKAYLELLNEAMEDMDIDRSDELIGKLTGLRLPDEAKPYMESLKAAVTDLDTDMVKELSEKITDVIQTKEQS